MTIPIFFHVTFAKEFFDCDFRFLKYLCRKMGQKSNPFLIRDKLRNFYASTHLISPVFHLERGKRKILATVSFHPERLNQETKWKTTGKCLKQDKRFFGFKLKYIS